MILCQEDAEEEDDTEGGAITAIIVVVVGGEAGIHTMAIPTIMIYILFQKHHKLL